MKTSITPRKIRLCHYIVFHLADRGDLLELLKTKPEGFPESVSQNLIRQACQGLADLHKRGLAMQDVSLENLLVFTAGYAGVRVKLCDPGQAV